MDGAYKKNPQDLGKPTREGDRPEANGETVALLGCGSDQLGLVIEPKNENMSYVTLSGGNDDATTVRGAINALNAMVTGYIQSGIEDGVRAGNAALKRSAKTDPRDKNDELVRTGATSVVVEIKDPPL